jgi:dolichol kinase
MAMAGLAYAIAEAIVNGKKKAIDREDERPRKLAHVMSNLLACLLIWLLGTQMVSYYVLAATTIGILVMHLTIVGVKVPGIEEWLKNVGRKGETPGEGALYNALGILFALGLLKNDPAAVICVILILGLGDGLSTYAGTTYGKHKLPWNRSKSLEGSIGFFAGAICTMFVMPEMATFIVVAIAAIVESLPIKLNDNITLPVMSSLLFYFML